MMQYEGSLEFVLYIMIMYYDLIPTPCEFVLYIMIMYYDLIPTPCAPKGSVGCLSSPLWNPRSVIWSHCSISYLAVLPNPVAHCIQSFFCKWSIFWLFLHKFSEILLCCYYYHYYYRSVNLFTAAACKLSGLKDARTTCKQFVFRSCNNLLLMLYVLMKISSHACARKKTKRLEGFKFGTFIGRLL